MGMTEYLKDEFVKQLHADREARDQITSLERQIQRIRDDLEDRRPIQEHLRAQLDDEVVRACEQAAVSQRPRLFDVQLRPSPMNNLR
jgi:hypothetical protein